MREVLLQSISRISWRLIFNSSAALLSFSIVHYVFYMRYFGGELLLLYPSDFYFQFCFLFVMHFASAALLGNIAFYTANYAIIIFAEDVFQLRNARNWRRIKLGLYRIHRRKYPKMVSIAMLSLFFFCLTYLGFSRALIFFMLVIFFVFALSFLQEHKGLFKLINLRIRRKKINRMFTAERLAVAISAIASTPRLRKELFNIGRSSFIAIAAPAILVAAASSGYLRASNIADNIEVVVTKDSTVFSGVIYASSSTGVLVYSSGEDVGIFLPAGSFTARTN